MLLFFFNDTSTTDINPYLHTRSLHSALPIYRARHASAIAAQPDAGLLGDTVTGPDSGRSQPVGHVIRRARIVRANRRNPNQPELRPVAHTIDNHWNRVLGPVRERAQLSRSLERCPGDRQRVVEGTRVYIRVAVRR